LSQKDRTTNSGQFMKKGTKKPYYGNRTKRQIIDEYMCSSASLDELSELHGILGSNTLADWVKNSRYSPKHIEDIKYSKSPSPTTEKQRRKKRFKMDVHLRIEELEEDLETAKNKVQFYQTAMDFINNLAKEMIGIDLLKKTGQALSKRSMSKE